MIVTIGLIATRSVESILVAQIDRTLAGFVGRGPGPGSHPEPPDDEFFRPIAEVLVDDEGSVVESRPSGFSDDPDPLPDVSDLQDEEGTVNLPAVDGSMEYRAVIADLNDEARSGHSRAAHSGRRSRRRAAPHRGARRLRHPPPRCRRHVVDGQTIAATRGPDGGDRRGHRLRRPVSTGARSRARAPNWDGSEVL